MAETEIFKLFLLVMARVGGLMTAVGLCAVVLSALEKGRADELDDNYLITLDFGNATLGMVDTGYCSKAQRTPSIEVYGTLGTICFTSDPKAPLDVYIDVPDRKIRGWTKPSLQKIKDLDFFQCMCLKDLIDAIEQDRPVGLPPEHARHVVEIMCKIPIAAKEQRVLPLTTTF